jgi:spermidine synthase
LVVLPTIGLRGGMLLAVAGYVVAAHVIAPPGWRLRPLLHAIVLVAAVADPARAPLANLYPGVERLRALYEGPAGVTSVVDVRGNLQLRMDNYYVLGGNEAATNERRLGLLPLLLHPDPARVLFIGLATGITASAGPALGVADTTIVEIVPEVATAALEHFGTWNDDLLASPDVHLVIDDGRRYLQANDRRFDVVVSDLFIPWHAGTSSLYAREMYEIVARRLAPGGLFCQWLPLYQLTREEFDVVVKTVLAVFPHATLWRDDFYPNRPVVGLVGRAEAEPLDLERAAERAAGLPTWGQDSLLAAPRGLAMFYAGNLATIADDFAPAPVNTDDRPVIEFLAPRLTRMSRTGDKDWFVGEPLAAFYDRLLARDPDVAAAIQPASEGAVEARRAGLALFRYVLASESGDELAAARFQDQVRASVPEVIATFGQDAALADAGSLRESLRALRNEQETVRHRLEEMQRNLERLGARED